MRKVKQNICIILNLFYKHKGIEVSSGALWSDAVYRKTVSRERSNVFDKLWSFETVCIDTVTSFGAKFIELYDIDTGKNYSVDVETFKRNANFVDLREMRGGVWYFCPLKYWVCSETDKTSLKGGPP